MNLSTETGQEVTELALDVFDRAGRPAERAVEKLVRDSFIWSHLAGDSVQRMKVAKKLLH